MRKEIGKWLMDVAKYVLTAVIISTIFKEMQDKWMYVIASIIAITTFSLGLWFLHSKKEEDLI